MLGGILGAIGFFQVAILANVFNVISSYWVLIGLTVCFSLIGIVTVGNNLRFNASFYS